MPQNPTPKANLFPWMDSTQLVQWVFLIVNAYSCKHHHLYPPPTLWTQYEHGWDLSLVRLYQSNNNTMSHGQPSLEIHPHLFVEIFLEKLSTKPLIQMLMIFWSILNINTNMLMPSYIIQQAKCPLGNGFHPFFKKVTYPFSTLFITHTFFFPPPFTFCDKVCYHLPCDLRPHGTWKINDHATPLHSQG
jgi:hypothetical protein